MPPTPNRRPRPINPFDNPATTGLAVNPNGTYIANPFPTTAQNGAQGAFGAMLPQVQVQPAPASTGQTWIQMAANRAATPAPTATLQYTSPIGPTLPPPSGYYPSTQNRGMFDQSVEASAARLGNAPVYGPSSGRADPGLIRRIAQNPQELQNLAPAQREAVERLLVQSAGGELPGGTQTLGKGDFYGYERDPETGRSVRVVKNAANGDNFSKELRWDPDRKKYVQIGKLMREGKLGKDGSWRSKKRRGGGGKGRGQAGASSPGVQETTGGFTGSYGVVNFNTGTG